MGEITEMIMDGTLCNVCGSLMEDLIPEYGNELKQPPGYSRTCEDCQEWED
ncbi:hypothetical protein [Mammaliicoccus sciuri]|uniref:hypothetical protein n=1 Tax=Mammaliicoccus sciuri TaxID=1296 RepID=UPI001C4F8119|nr:hypothetical protein [Mammaliicoccus sciuri]